MRNPFKNKYRGHGVIIKSPENLVLGERVGLNDHVWINAKGGVFIGSDTLVGPYVIIHSSNHNYQRNKLISEQGHTDKSVAIGSDCWIGGGAKILPGAIIPDGCIIGAGGVVTSTSKMKPYEILVGNPVKKIGERI